VRVLAVDTTTPRGSLAVVSDEAVEAEVRVDTPNGHSRWLVGAVECTLAGLGVEPRELDGFAVIVGPGSFTGLRVGLSTVQGLGLATGRPCLGLSALDVLAASATGTAPSVVALVDGNRGEVFGGVYGADGHRRGESRCGAIADLVAGLEGTAAFVGDGALRYRAEIGDRVPGAVFPEVDLHLAASLGRRALGPLRAGEGGPPGDLRPLYLRAPHIRKPRR